MDDSNKFLFWEGLWIYLKHPEIFAASYLYFRQDVTDNIRDVENK